MKKEYITTMERFVFIEVMITFNDNDNVTARVTGFVTEMVALYTLLTMSVDLWAILLTVIPGAFCTSIVAEACYLLKYKTHTEEEKDSMFLRIGFVGAFFSTGIFAVCWYGMGWRGVQFNGLWTFVAFLITSLF